MWRSSATLLSALLILHSAAAADPAVAKVEVYSDPLGAAGMRFPESTPLVYKIHLNVTLNEKGEGGGTLVLDPNHFPNFDEFGFPAAADAVPAAKTELECTFKFLKRTTRTYTSLRLGAPESEKEVVRQEWRLYSLTGPNVKSRLFVATDVGTQWRQCRLLVGDADGKVKHVVELKSPPPAVPCHPGCFPAGTRISTPGGVKPVEDVKAGDVVVTVGADGKGATGKVASVFVTRNRLIEVRTENRVLVTTETQPLSLVGGGLRAAGELKAGDRIYSWDGKERQAVKVREVVSAKRESQVFNLILGEPVLFVANGFLARSKPPAAANGPAMP